MKKLKLYLDNCCFNRPFDDQRYLSIKLETEAKIFIQDQIKCGNINLAWSYILDYENTNNPFIERKIEIAKWKKLAISDIDESENILLSMSKLIIAGIKPLDALHISCAIESDCDYFLTVDKGIIKKRASIDQINIVTPIEFINITEES